MYTTEHTLLDAVTETTTSEALNISEALGITLMLTREDHSSGSTSFSVIVSIDGVTYVTYSKLIDNVTNTNSQTLTRIDAKSLAANTSSAIYMDLENEPYKFMKVVATETTDGTHTVVAMLRRESIYK